MLIYGVVGFLLGMVVGMVYGSFGTWFLYVRGKKDKKLQKDYTEFKMRHDGIQTVPPTQSEPPEPPCRQK